MHANRLVNITRRIQVASSVKDIAKRKANGDNSDCTLKAYVKEAARLMRPSKDIGNKKEHEEERQDGAEKLRREILTIDLKNPIHAARSLRVAEKHKAIAGKWRSHAHAEDRRRAKGENADPKKGLKRVAKQISSQTANSLRYVIRDDRAADGGKAGTLTAIPKVIDGVITRAWQHIHEGNVSDVDGVVSDFLKKCRTTLFA